MALVLPSTVHDPTTGVVATVAWGDAVNTAVAWLANPPSCRVYNNATISLTDNTETSLTFNTERFDTDTMHDTSTNTGRITIKTAGTYLVGFHGRIAAATDYVASYFLLRVNGTTVIASQGLGNWGTGATPLLFSVVTLYAFSVNDYVEVRGYQDNSANAARNVLFNANDSPEFWATWHSL
jgi:hypothetical protein